MEKNKTFLVCITKKQIKYIIDILEDVKKRESNLYTEHYKRMLKKIIEKLKNEIK